MNKDKSALVKNLQTLSRVHGCELNASKFTQYMDDKSGRKVIDRSYIARIFKNSDKDPANITLNKLDGISEALGVESWQLINPMGFDENGVSRAANGGLDGACLKRAISYSISASEELGIESIDFISELAKDSYLLMVTDEEEKLGVRLAKLSRQFT